MHAGLIVYEKRKLKRNSYFKQKHLKCVDYGRKRVHVSSKKHSKDKLFDLFDRQFNIVHQTKHVHYIQFMLITVFTA